MYVLGLLGDLGIVGLGVMRIAKDCSKFFVY